MQSTRPTANATNATTVAAVHSNDAATETQMRSAPHEKTTESLKRGRRRSETARPASGSIALLRNSAIAGNAAAANAANKPAPSAIRTVWRLTMRCPPIGNAAVRYPGGAR